MATLVEQALAEVEAALIALAPPREGFKDLSKLVKPENTEAVNAVVLGFDRRWELLKDWQRVTALLLGDGYPKTPSTDVPPEVYADIKDNTSTVDAAFAITPSGAAATLSLSGGEPEPKF